jgi:hypothetical protein
LIGRVKAVTASSQKKGDGVFFAGFAHKKKPIYPLIEMIPTTHTMAWMRVVLTTPAMFCESTLILVDEGSHVDACGYIPCISLTTKMPDR